MANLPRYDDEVVDFILAKISVNCTYKEIFKCLVDRGILDSNSNYVSFERYVTRLTKKKGIIKNNKKISEVDKKIIKLLEIKKAIKLHELTDYLGCNKKTVSNSIKNCVKNGYEIIVNNDLVILSTTNVRESENVPKLGETEVIFGVVSDPHFGSKSCQITALNEFSNIMRRKGVKHVFVPGDLVAGHEVYPGQIHDVYAMSATEQEETTLLNLPTGFDWYVLGGNHDYSYVKRGGGYNIISVIANKRLDVHYVGFDEATIPILNNVDVMLGHPSGGVPYSVSYRLQKNIEQITIGELQNVVRGVKDKPSIRFVLLGHLHIQMQAMFGSIFGAQCGTFEGQTNYLKRKGLVPCIGGWIIKASLGNNGLLKNFDAKFYIFDEVKDDWKNYKHTIPEQKIEKPIFEK
jgi:DNA-binding Lrp family transcriptional regulator